MGLRKTRQGRPPQPSEAKAHRPSDLKSIVRLLDRFMVGQRRLFVFALVMLILEAVTAVFEAYPLAYLIDFLQGNRPDLMTALRLRLALEPTIGTVALLTGAIVVLAGLNSAADSMAEIYLASGGRRLGYNLRTALFAHLQRLSLAFHDQRRTGDTLTRVTGDVTAVEEFVIASLSDIAGSLLVLTGTLTFLLFRSWEVALVAAVIVPLLAGVSHFFSQRIKSATRKQRAREGELASATQEMLTSIRVIQTFGRAGVEQERFGETSQRNVDAALEAAGVQAGFSFVVKLMEALFISAIVWVGLWLMFGNTLTVGTLILFVVLIQNMFKPTRRIIKEWSTIGKVYASVERIAELLDRRPAVQDAPGAVQAPPLLGLIEFRRVGFAYRIEEEDAVKSGKSHAQPRPALKDVSFHVPPGRILGLVGHTGAGKSTIAQLLPRLYDPDEGEIRIDGHDVREFTLDSLRAQISVVLQETVLVSGTVAENIAYGRRDATMEEIVSAAHQANVDEFIDKLPEGYGTLLGERGVNLSGGQRQRIAIARAIIRNTPILILDEPTTGLDAESSELVLQALLRLIRGKTTIIISHDLRLIRHADKVMVMKEGEVEEIGAHAALLKSGGLYAQLYLKQFGRIDVEGEPAESNGPLIPDAAAVRRLADDYLDTLHNPALRRSIPGLSAAFDPEAMGETLQSALFGRGRARLRIVRCRPGKGKYRLDGTCSLRYELEVEDGETGRVLTPLVNARLFPNRENAEAFMNERLAPLAEGLAGRTKAELGSPMALVDPLNMAVAVFPLDADLPMLIGATNERRMLEAFRQSLPEALSGQFAIESCAVDLGHYGRQHRCVLRYRLDGRAPIDDAVVQQLVYGKVAVDGRGALAGPVIAALRERLLVSRGRKFQLPRPLGYWPGLQLVLLDSLPGEPRISDWLVEHQNGNGHVLAEPQAITLEESLDTCASIAAMLHGSGIGLGRLRSLNDDMAELEEKIYPIWRVAPAFAEYLRARHEQLGDHIHSSHPTEPVFSHGDFTYSQVIFDGQTAGLVDFDTVCQAEPALDLGQFMAYLRLAARRAQGTSNGRASGLAEALCERFFQTYNSTVGGRRVDAENLRRRVAIYEVVSLMRLALHSWQKFKTTRLDLALDLLEERMACFP